MVSVWRCTWVQTQLQYKLRTTCLINSLQLLCCARLFTGKYVHMQAKLNIYLPANRYWYCRNQSCCTRWQQSWHLAHSNTWDSMPWCLPHPTQQLFTLWPVNCCMWWNQQSQQQFTWQTIRLTNWLHPNCLLIMLSLQHGSGSAVSLTSQPSYNVQMWPNFQPLSTSTDIRYIRCPKKCPIPYSVLSFS